MWSKEQQKEIEKIAYLKWEKAGKPDGLSHVFWRLAEKQLDTYLFHAFI